MILKDNLCSIVILFLTIWTVCAKQPRRRAVRSAPEFLRVFNRCDGVCAIIKLMSKCEKSLYYNRMIYDDNCSFGVDW